MLFLYSPPCGCQARPLLAPLHSQRFSKVEWCLHGHLQLDQDPGLPKASAKHCQAIQSAFASLTKAMIRQSISCHELATHKNTITIIIQLWDVKMRFLPYFHFIMLHRVAFQQSNTLPVGQLHGRDWLIRIPSTNSETPSVPCASLQQGLSKWWGEWHTLSTPAVKFPPIPPTKQLGKPNFLSGLPSPQAFWYIVMCFHSPSRPRSSKCSKHSLRAKGSATEKLDIIWQFRVTIYQTFLSWSPTR